MVTEQRSASRVPTSITAHLISDNLNIPCTILDLSANGARLEIQPGLFLPKVLLLRARELGADRAVRVMWRNKTQLGVYF